MEKYNIITQVGSGSFGIVSKALNNQTGEVVAIKKLINQHKSWEECLNMIEIKSLIKFNNHPNIVKLKEIIKEYDTLFMVFEYMECSLYERIMERKKNGPPFLESEIKDICFQIFQGLAYMHKKGYFHRDLKPENILVSEDVVKIGDLGQAREVNSKVPYSDYVTSRWYRAPEVLFCCPVYDSSVDMWAMGAIMAELFTLDPLFKGCSEQDMIYKICKVLGTLTESTWRAGFDLAIKLCYRVPDFAGVAFSKMLPNASADAVSLISALLSWHPCTRPTALEVLQHPFFSKCYNVPRPVCHEPGGVASSLISGPVVFQMATRRELLKKKRSWSDVNDSEGPRLTRDLISVLPGNSDDLCDQRSHKLIKFI